MIAAIDGFILSFFTKISHKFYRLTGLTNFFLAKISLYVAATSIIVIILGFWFPVLDYKPPPPLLLDVFLAFLCLLSLQFDIYLCDKADDAIFSNNRVSFFCPLISSPYYRFLWILFAVNDLTHLARKIFNHKGIIIFMILVNAFSPALASFNYLVLVDPPTPGKSKVREWIESFSTGFRKLALVKN